MTPRQAEQLQKKITTIKSTLAAEKRKFGDYDDSRGLRYLPTRLFLQLGDFAGGLRYTRWFHQAFSDDAGFPDFLFEWTVILFKSGKLKEAAKKAFETFCSNTYLFDKYFGTPLVEKDIWHSSNLDGIPFANYFNYDSLHPGWEDFSDWLERFIETEKFKTASAAFIDLERQLKTERDIHVRGRLIDRQQLLKDEF